MLNYAGGSSLLVILFISQMHCCHYSIEEDQIVCNDLVQVSIEGNNTWSKLIVSNTKDLLLEIQPNSFKSCSNLRELSLTDVINIHNGAFTGLEKLDKLSIFSSRVAANIQEDVFDNLPIRELQIYGSEMTQIPAGLFDDLEKVRIVDFRKNHLKILKAGVFNNTPIYKLHLDSNEIETIEDETFIHMKFLIHLDLSRNKLKTFESKRVLGTSNTVSTIMLNRNKLTILTKKLIDSVPYLEQIFLEENMIDAIENGSFNKVRYINFIDLSNNHLSEFPPRIFPAAGLKKLYLLLLHNNRFTFIKKALFTRTSELHYLSIGGNPLQCSCLAQLKSVTSSRNISRICDEAYDSNERPGCIYRDQLRFKCVYDVESTKNLYEQYNETIAQYPKLPLKCDATRGFSKAALSNSP